MASLEELKKRLYKEKENFSERSSSPDLFRPSKEFSYQPEQEEKKLPKFKGRNFFRNLKFSFFWGTVSILAVAILAILFFLFGAGSVFKLDAPRLEIQGLKEIKSGDRIVWEAVVTNTTKKTINDAVLVFSFPPDASPVSGSKPAGIFRERRSIGLIRAGQSISEDFDAYVFGGRGSSKQVSALLEYRPEGVSAVLAKEASFDFNIAQAPVAISFTMPDELRIGQETDIEIHYISQSETRISNLLVAVTFPEGFEFISSAPSENPTDTNSDKNTKFWKIPELTPNTEGVIKIKGTIQGNDLESKSFSAKIGMPDQTAAGNILSYDEAAHSSTLRSPFLEVSMAIGGNKNNFVVSGDRISVNVNWKNNLPDEIKNAILEVKLDGSSLDLGSLAADRGSYSESQKSIIWNSSTYDKFKDIKSGDSGSVSFAFKIKNNLIFESGASRPLIKLNAVFKIAGSVPGHEGFDVSGYNELDLKVSSRLQFSSKVIYFNSPFLNTGSLPPKVGRETTYAVIWSLANTTNDVDNVVVRSSLPPYIDYKNIMSPADTNLSYDQSTGVLEWKAGRVSAGTGFSSPAIQISFQVGLTPSLNQVGTAPVIVNDAEAAARDTFTDQPLSSTDSQITTELPDDPAIDFSQKNVVK